VTALRDLLPATRYRLVASSPPYLLSHHDDAVDNLPTGRDASTVPGKRDVTHLRTHLAVVVALAVLFVAMLVLVVVVLVALALLRVARLAAYTSGVPRNTEHGDERAWAQHGRLGPQ
jgi:hypothetical protein